MPTLKDQSMCTSGFKLWDKPFPCGDVERPVWVRRAARLFHGQCPPQTQHLVSPATSLAQEPVWRWLWVSPDLCVVNSWHCYACVKLLIKVSSKYWLDRRQMYSSHLDFPWKISLKCSGWKLIIWVHIFLFLKKSGWLDVLCYSYKNPSCLKWVCLWAKVGSVPFCVWLWFAPRAPLIICWEWSMWEYTPQPGPVQAYVLSQVEGG